MEQPSTHQNPILPTHTISDIEDHDIMGTIQNLISQVTASDDPTPQSPIQTPPQLHSTPKTKKGSGKQTPGLPIKSARAKNSEANIEDINDSNNNDGDDDDDDDDDNDHYNTDRNWTDIQDSQSQRPPSTIVGVPAEELSDDDSDIIIIEDFEPTTTNDMWSRAEQQHVKDVGAAWRASQASVKLEPVDQEEIPPKKIRRFPLE